MAATWQSGSNNTFNKIVSSKVTFLQPHLVQGATTFVTRNIGADILTVS